MPIRHGAGQGCWRPGGQTEPSPGSVAVSMAGSCPGSPGEREQWLGRFDMFDLGGGRTASTTLSVVAARRFDRADLAFPGGGCAWDLVTLRAISRPPCRREGGPPACRRRRKRERDMVVLLYSDRL